MIAVRCAEQNKRFDWTNCWCSVRELQRLGKGAWIALNEDRASEGC